MEQRVTLLPPDHHRIVGLKHGLSYKTGTFANSPMRLRASKSVWKVVEVLQATRGSGTGPALTGVIDQGRSSKVGYWFEAVSK